LVYGPYWALTKGNYSVTVTIAAEGSSTGNIVDVTSDLGRQLLAKQSLAGDTSGPQSRDIELPFRIRADTEGFEIRVFYDGQGKMKISKVVLAKQ